MRWALAHTPTYPARPHLPHHQRPHLPAPPPPLPTQDFFESGATAAAPATAAVLPKPKVAVAGAKPVPAASASEVSSAITLKGAQLAWAILHRARLQARREPRGVPHVSGVVCSTHRASKDNTGFATVLAGGRRRPTFGRELAGVVGAIEISHSLRVQHCQHTEPWAFGPFVNSVFVSLQRAPSSLASCLHCCLFKAWRLPSCADLSAQW